MTVDQQARRQLSVLLSLMLAIGLTSIQPAGLSFPGPAGVANAADPPLRRPPTRQLRQPSRHRRPRRAAIPRSRRRPMRPRLPSPDSDGSPDGTAASDDRAPPDPTAAPTDAAPPAPVPHCRGRAGHDPPGHPARRIRPDDRPAGRIGCRRGAAALRARDPGRCAPGRGQPARQLRPRRARLRELPLDAHRRRGRPHEGRLPERALLQRVTRAAPTSTSSRSSPASRPTTTRPRATSRIRSPRRARPTISPAPADEFEATLDRHAVCADCHNPHDATATRPQLSTTGWTASGEIRAAPGVSVTNNLAGEAPRYTLVSREQGQSLTYEYELCLQVPLRLHDPPDPVGDQPVVVGPRQGHRAQPAEHLLPPGRGRRQERQRPDGRQPGGNIAVQGVGLRRRLHRPLHALPRRPLDGQPDAERDAPDARRGCLRGVARHHRTAGSSSRRIATGPSSRCGEAYAAPGLRALLPVPRRAAVRRPEQPDIGDGHGVPGARPAPAGHRRHPRVRHVDRPGRAPARASRSAPNATSGSTRRRRASSRATPRRSPDRPATPASSTSHRT